MTILGGIPGSIRPEPRDAAEAFLRELLADGPVPSREVVEAAVDAGLSETTLKRARKALGVETEKTGTSNVWYMLLPGTDWQAFLSAHPIDTAPPATDATPVEDDA